MTENSESRRGCEKAYSGAFCQHKSVRPSVEIKIGHSAALRSTNMASEYGLRQNVSDVVGRHSFFGISVFYLIDVLPYSSTVL